MTDDFYNVECEDCGWSGNDTELVCSEEDGKSGKPVSAIRFNRCPDCDSLNIVDIDEHDED